MMGSCVFKLNRLNPMIYSIGMQNGIYTSLLRVERTFADRVMAPISE